MSTTLPGTEKGFTHAVIEYAQLHGWKVAHFRPGRTGSAWKTPVSGNGKGFPDLVLVRDGRLIFAELKTNHGWMSREQREWLSALMSANQSFFIWRPEDWEQIEGVLKK